MSQIRTAPKTLLFAFLFLLLGGVQISRAQSHVVMSQVYGGGGNSGATYRYDFVELYNPTAAAVDLSNYTIQYAASTGSSWSKVQLAGSIQAGKYYLAQLCIGNLNSTNGALLPTPDFVAPNTDTPASCVPLVAAAAGKLALVSNTTALSGTGGTVSGLGGTSCPTTNTAAIVDFVGFGAATTCYEGSGVAVSANLSATLSASRNSTNDDTGDNRADFTAATPNPRNSSNSTGPVAPPVVVTPIATIQANRSTYVGNTISATGVITAVTTAGYYLQTPSSTPGSTGDEGIYVYSAGNNPAGAVVGNNVTITGLLTQFPSPAASHTPSLEVTNTVLVVNSTGNALPAAIPITSLTSTGGIYQLTRYEGMRVSFASLTAVSPTAGNLTENTETTASTGQFYAVVTGTARPFREPGMDFRDFPATTCPTLTNCTATATAAGVARPSNLTLFDDNPERIIVESSLGGGTALDVSTGAVLSAPTGVIDFTYATDVPYGDPARLILDPGTFNVTSGITVKPLSVPGAGVTTVAAFNVERFFDTNSANDKYYNASTGNVGTSLAVDVTADAYARRLKKISLAIRTVLNNPDIIALEEVENVGVVRDIAAQIDTDTTTGTKPGYVAYGTDSSSTYTDDVGGISVGFLVKSTAGVTKWEQIGNTTTFTASTGTQTLNDRPSQVLHATISRGTGVKPYPLTVIVNHLRSLSGIGTSADTRLKKELQAEMLATAIQGYQANGEHVIAVGDMNAFQFSDGYTDTLGTITGNVGTNVAAQPGKAGILTTPAVDLITTLPAAQQQTYVEFGNAQVLDHAVVTADLAGISSLQVAHLDSDFPEILGNDATSPARVSDHDVPVTYITVPAAVTTATLTGTATFPSTLVGASSAGQQFTLTNTGETPITTSGFTTTGDFSQSNNCGASLAISSSCVVNVVFAPTASGARTGTLSLTGVSAVTAVTLSGTAIAPASATLTGTASFPSTVIGLSSAAQQYTLTNTGGLTVTVTGFSTTGDFTQTNNCGTSLAVGSSCVVSVVFKPTVAGTRSGTLTFAGSVAVASVALSGTGLTPPDFSIADTTSSAATTAITIPAGYSGTFSVKLTSLNGFVGTVSFTCTPSGTAPAGVTCTVPAPVALASAGTATANITFTTTARTVTSGLGGSPSDGTGREALWVLAGMIAAAALAVGRRGGRARTGSLLLLLFALALGISGCGSSTTTSANANGTPAGVYIYNVTAVSGSVTHTDTVTLTVP